MSTIGGNLGLGRSNIEQALQAMKQRSQELQGIGQTEPSKASFGGSLSDSVVALNQTVQATETLHLEALKGDMDFHEVAARVKEAQLSFDFAMQVRNKLIDAYREVMRMSV
ncbi:MAG: flagellar hook-basal body complex protein FliE [Planctomycetes bacterium]|nr:flagellar hook-basal body complex protein FliE [Planctomycetota bacterium]MCB9907957.1 flagellar hook-basal body complex protein FliE [Planctomycetota bacterium]MCB9909977.1 flagellar hook-basal body complex protein FliE [Planctomycetota bacterium]HPF12711.1 flagellar hook-basal body complex protein FliE [Planctomycetota bacterium]HRV80618.1 flagellar hook-basal body complex protein FliE [Planctomycetota bacterium]